MGDPVVVFEVTESLAERGSLHIERDLSWYETNPGWSYFSSGTSVVAVPFYLAGKWTAVALGAEDAWPTITFFGAMTNAFIGALAVGLLYLFCIDLGVTRRSATIASLILMTSTGLWSSTQALLREPLAALGMTAALRFLYVGCRDNRAQTLVAASLCAVVMTMARTELWILMPFMALYAVFGWRARSPGVSTRAAVMNALALLAAPAATAPVVLYFNAMKFGDPLKFGYSGLSLQATPLLIGLNGLLASPMFGLLVFSPIFIFGLAGLPALIQRDKPAGILVASMSVFLVVFYAKYAIWSGFMSNGPRFLISAAPLLVLPIAAILDRNDTRAWVMSLLIMAAVWSLIQQVTVVLGDADAFHTRIARWFGENREYVSSFTFLHSPFRLYRRLIAEGLIDLGWLNLTESGIPAALLAVPAACLAAAGWSLIFIVRRFRAPDLSAASLRRPDILWPAAACACLALPLVLDAAFVRQGLNLSLWDAGDAASVSRSAALRAFPIVDEFESPFRGRDATKMTAFWEGALEIPSEYYNNILYLQASGRAVVEIGGQVQFLLDAPEPGVGRMMKKLDLGRGYHPVRIEYQPGRQEPLFHLRWTIQDYAFRSSIRDQYWFPSVPTLWQKALIRAQFYSGFGLCVALWILLANIINACRNPQDAPPRP